MLTCLELSLLTTKTFTYYVFYILNLNRYNDKGLFVGIVLFSESSESTTIMRKRFPCSTSPV